MTANDNDEASISDFPLEEFHAEFVQLPDGDHELRVRVSGATLDYLEGIAAEYGMTLAEYFERVVKPRMLGANDA